MYITNTFLWQELSQYKHLFFYLTEDYSEWQTNLTEQIKTLLTYLWRELKQYWAVVLPFDRDISSINNEIITKWKDKYTHEIKDKTPWILIIDRSFSDFNIDENEYLYISFRNYMDEYGKFRVFEVETLLKLIIKSCNNDDLIELVKKYIHTESIKANTWKILELKPGIFWFNIDLEEGIKILKEHLK